MTARTVFLPKEPGMDRTWTANRAASQADKKIKDPFNSEEHRRNWVKPGIKNPKKTLFTPTRQSRPSLIISLLISRIGLITGLSMSPMRGK